MDFAAFQRRFIAAVDNPAYRTVAASWPRGCGKTTVAGHLVARALTPGDSLYREGAETVLFAGSIEQCRLTYRQALSFLEPRIGEYRTVDSATRVAITRKDCRTRLKAVGSNPKTSLGLVGVPLAILDEPAALHTVGGAGLWDAIRTAMGKPRSPLKAVLTGTIAPAAPGSWWPNLVERGTVGSTFVTKIQGRAERWKEWREVLRCNPLARDFPETREVLREELDAALADSRLAAAYRSYRLNLPTADESEMVLTVPDWERVLSRPVAERQGPPIVGLDLGSGRAWSAAVAVWRTGRVEALAVAPGVPDLEAQEKRDRVPAGQYRMLAETGALRVADGVRVQPVPLLWGAVLEAFGVPEMVAIDRFRLGELSDAIGGTVPIVSRVARWSDATADIRGLRKLALDGPLSVVESSRALLGASLGVAKVQNDDSGNVRIVKRGTNNTARDDVAAALILAAGATKRLIDTPPPQLTITNSAYA